MGWGIMHVHCNIYTAKLAILAVRMKFLELLADYRFDGRAGAVAFEMFSQLTPVFGLQIVEEEVEACTKKPCDEGL